MVRIMIRLIMTITVGAMCIFSTVIFAAGFDCAKAKSAVEKLICSENELSKADEQLSHIYSKALASSANTAEFKKEQLDWIRAKRDPCRNKECVAEAYKKRIEVLSGPAPVEEYYLRERFSTGDDTEEEVGGEEPEDGEAAKDEGGTDDKKPGGSYYHVCVKVHGNPSAPLIDFEVYFPDSGQSVTAEFVRCKTTKGGSLDFAFTDSWGNRGKGTLNRSGEEATLVLEEVKPVEEAGRGRMALRNYGTYELTKQECGSGEE